MDADASYGASLGKIIQCQGSDELVGAALSVMLFTNHPSDEPNTHAHCSELTSEVHRKDVAHK